MMLDPETIAWIEEAIGTCLYGKITLLTQNGKVMKIFTEGDRKNIPPLCIDKYNDHS